MPVHLHSLVRSGVVSPRSYRRMMADHASAQDEGNAPPGQIKAGEIDRADYQTKGSRALNLGGPSRSGGVQGGPPQAGPGHINKSRNKRKFPTQSHMRGKPGTVVPSRISGAVHHSKTMIGTGT